MKGKKPSRAISHILHTKFLLDFKQENDLEPQQDSGAKQALSESPIQRLVHSSSAEVEVDPDPGGVALADAAAVIEVLKSATQKTLALNPWTQRVGRFAYWEPSNLPAQRWRFRC